MAAKSGRNGELKIDVSASVDDSSSGTQIALLHLRSWSIDQSANIQTVDLASMTNHSDWTQAFTLSRSWTGSFTVLWDAADGAMDDIEVGFNITFTCYPDYIDAASSFIGTGVISQVTTSSSYDGLVEQSFTVVGNGAITVAD